jgi:hypothetical protein
MLDGMDNGITQVARQSAGVWLGCRCAEGSCACSPAGADARADAPSTMPRPQPAAGVELPAGRDVQGHQRVWLAAAGGQRVRRGRAGARRHPGLRLHALAHVRRQVCVEGAGDLDTCVAFSLAQQLS